MEYEKHTVFCLQHPQLHSKWVQRAGHVYSIDRPHSKLVLHCAVAGGHTRTSTQTLLGFHLVFNQLGKYVDSEQRTCTVHVTNVSFLK